MHTLYLILLACSAGILTSCDKHEKRETKYPNGQIQEQFSVLETENGSFIKDGEYKKCRFDGQPEITGSYNMGKQTGNWKYWYKNGQLKQDCNMTMDSLDGSFISWFPSGQKEMEGKYNRGQPTGPWLGWYKNGQMEYKRNYSSTGKKDGLQTDWYEDGQKACEENYAEGVKEGDMKFWDTKGKLCGFRTFRKGVDSSLPAVYKDNHGLKLKLELAADDTYKATYSGHFFGNRTNSGKFEVSYNELNLIGFGRFYLKKYTPDTVAFNLFGDNAVLVKQLPKPNDQLKQK